MPARERPVARRTARTAAVSDDSGDDNERHTIPIAQRCPPTVVGHRVSATVGHGSGGRCWSPEDSGDGGVANVGANNCPG
jgi:hypothetical protein